jgi:hypothetical protein
MKARYSVENRKEREHMLAAGWLLASPQIAIANVGK